MSTALSKAAEKFLRTLYSRPEEGQVQDRLNQHRRRVRGSSTEHGCFTVWKFDNTQGAEHAPVLEGRCPRASGQGVAHAAGVLAGRRREADDEARARPHRGIRLGCVLGTAVRHVVRVPGRRCRSNRGCRCLRQDAGRARDHGRQLERIRAEPSRGRRPVLVTEQANLDRLSWRAAAAQRERGLRRHPKRVRRRIPTGHRCRRPRAPTGPRSRRVGSHSTSRSTTPASSLRCSSPRWRLARRHSWWQRGSGSADRDGGEP